MVDQPKTPEILALVIAKDVRRDEATGRYTVEDTYNHIVAPSFPWSEPALIVYLACEDSQGRVEMHLRLVDADQLRPPVFDVPIIMHFPNPASTVEGGFFATDLQFPEPGEYRLQVLRDETLLLERRVIVSRGSKNGNRLSRGS
jgi:hypothetical protein